MEGVEEDAMVVEEEYVVLQRGQDSSRWKARRSDRASYATASRARRRITITDSDSDTPEQAVSFMRVPAKCQ